MVYCGTHWLNANAETYLKTSDYKIETVEGFSVHWSPEFQGQEKLQEAVRSEIQGQLKVAGKMLPKTAFVKLLGIRFWVETAAKTNGAAEYHTSLGWLRENSYNPDKEFGIEISNATNFLSWSSTDQPSMLLHELAHAYHDRVLGWSNSAVKAAYQNALSSKLYDKVCRQGGGIERAYALVDEREYFSELTEAYFGKNDFFPFIRSELEKHDPIGFKLIQKSWGDPVSVTDEDQ
ncbi:MAG: hypothetical protein SFY81_09280 [Verrucomicrobiota bacterium]|nr:hypothetical protein [Verrucomicrobiota bacterium]